MTNDPFLPRPRAPRDDSEAALMIALIRAELDAWPHATASVVGDPDARGAWLLVVEPPIGGEARRAAMADVLTEEEAAALEVPPFRPLDLRLDADADVEGAVWVGEFLVEGRPRPVVCWSLGGQANHAPHRPLLDWSSPAPATPGTRLAPEPADWPAAIRALLAARGWTIDRLAGRIGCTPNAVDKWLAGHRAPTGLYARALRAHLAAAGVETGG